MLEEAAAELGKLGGWDDPLLRRRAQHSRPARSCAMRICISPAGPAQHGPHGQQKQRAWRSGAAPAQLILPYDAAALVTAACSRTRSADVAASSGGALGNAGGASLGGGGTVVPFALRRIRAELPYWWVGSRGSGGCRFAMRHKGRSRSMLRQPLRGRICTRFPCMQTWCKWLSSTRAPPYRLGRQEESINRLYQLLEWCAEQEATAAAAATGGTSSSGNEATAAQRLWGRRHRDVLLTLVNRHCRGQQYPAALALLDRLLQRDGSDAAAWQEVGMVQALLGDTAAAATSLQRVEHLLLQQQQQDQQPGDADSAAMATPQLSAQQRQRLLHRNRGLLAILQHDYRGGYGWWGPASRRRHSKGGCAPTCAALIWCNA